MAKGCWSDDHQPFSFESVDLLEEGCIINLHNTTCNMKYINRKEEHF